MDKYVECISESDEDDEICEIKGADIRVTEEEIDVPVVGMKFNSVEEAYNFYKQYARRIGFGVCKRSSTKGDDGEVKFVIYSCVRQGKSVSRTINPLQPRPTAKTGCKARIRIFGGASGRFTVTQVELDHNHDLSPTKSRFHKCNRALTTAAKRRIEVDERAGIRMNKTFTAISVESGGYDKLPFLEKDCRNFKDKKRRLRLLEGDADAMHKYFLKMQADNSEFFYLMDLDEKGRLKNVFWADARSRAAFKEFGDVVTFDTTYLTNKYDMPFAPFVGVNHHGLSILLGCALISKEDTDTFVWLFRAWLVCMGGSPPNAIITDQDRAVRNAIEVVFPNARHRLCLWHIMKKLPEKLKSYNEYESIKFSIQNIVYDALTREEFEDRWRRFIMKYHLDGNDWLTGLYEERCHWVPAFVKDTFWDGMSTTQRSESMNAFFDGFVHAKTTLKEFVEQYENALRRKAEIESVANYRSYQTVLPLISHFEFEMQFRLVYTNDKFKEIQSEMARMMDCAVISSREYGLITEYEIEEYISYGYNSQIVGFKVCTNDSWDDVRCNCRLFEFRGIICRHIFTGMRYKRIWNISDKYIFERWSKNIRRKHSQIRICYDNWADTPEGRRVDVMSTVFHEVIDLAKESEEGCSAVVASLRSVKARLEKKDTCCSNQPNSSGKDKEVSMSQSNGLVLTKESETIGNPPEVHNKGRPRVRRLKSMSEKLTSKKKQTKEKVVSKKSIWQTKEPHKQYEKLTPLQTQIKDLGTQENFHLPLAADDVQDSTPLGYEVHMSNLNGVYFRSWI